MYKRNLKRELEVSLSLRKPGSSLEQVENRAEVLNQILELQSLVIDRKKAKMVDCQNSIDQNRNLGTEGVRNQN